MRGPLHSAVPTCENNPNSDECELVNLQYTSTIKPAVQISEAPTKLVRDDSEPIRSGE